MFGTCACIGMLGLRLSLHIFSFFSPILSSFPFFFALVWELGGTWGRPSHAQYLFLAWPFVWEVGICCPSVRWLPTDGGSVPYIEERWFLCFWGGGWIGHAHWGEPCWLISGASALSETPAMTILVVGSCAGLICGHAWCNIWCVKFTVYNWVSIWPSAIIFMISVSIIVAFDLWSHGASAYTTFVVQCWSNWLIVLSYFVFFVLYFRMPLSWRHT